ncbi:hypothetical protein D9M71_816350 [compost metagenome]
MCANQFSFSDAIAVAGSDKVPEIVMTHLIPAQVLVSPEEVPMREVMEQEIKRWTARRKSALVLEVIQGKTTVAAASS